VSAARAGHAGLTERDDHRAGRHRVQPARCHRSPIATASFDALAAGGLLDTNMHATALHTVTVDLPGDLISDTEGERRMAMMWQ
jgi:hypothetical protein